MNKVFTDGLSFALPLLIMAIGALYSEKSGVTNLAVEGFQGVGAFFGALTATLLAPLMGAGNQAKARVPVRTPRRIQAEARAPRVTSRAQYQARPLQAA